MKEILKKALIPICMSIVCGAICGKVVYEIYLGKNTLAYAGNLVYLLEAGTYDSYDNMRANTISYNYVYYEEDNLYKTIIGITKDKDNIEKIKSSYDGKVEIGEYYTEDEELNKTLNAYDEKLKTITDKEEIKKVVVDMLNLYKGENSKKLIKIS